MGKTLCSKQFLRVQKRGRACCQIDHICQVKLQTVHLMLTVTPKDFSSFIWSIAELLRGDFKQSEYAKVILPFVVLRRLDCLLKPKKDALLKANKNLPKKIDGQTKDLMLFEAGGGKLKIYNLSKFTFEKIYAQDPKDIHKNLTDYISRFNDSVRDIFLEKFRFIDQLKRLNDSGLLWQVFEKFYQIDLHSKKVSNLEMGYIFEELIRRFSEISNETAGEHFTPREVIRLIVDLLLIHDVKALAGSGVIRTVYDPACGTGGMLSIMEEAMKNLNNKVRVELYGQEINAESFGICKSDMLVTDHDPEQIAFGNTLVEDAHKETKFHYILSNPPYGVEWKKYATPIKDEHKKQGMDGRFGAGLPRISDGQLLFLQHMLSKMREDKAGSRVGIVMNGSPLFTGGASSGESEIRRWVIENDWLEAIIALPTDLFYNTSIQTYVWILTNKKKKNQHEKVQLIDASSERFWKAMKKSLGKKRREIPDKAREEIVKIYDEMLNGNSGRGEYSKVFKTKDFGFREIRVERPLKLNFRCDEKRLKNLEMEKAFIKLSSKEQKTLRKALSNIPNKLYKNRETFTKKLEKALAQAAFPIKAPLKKAILSALAEKDESAEACRDVKGKIEADTDLRDHELVPLRENWQKYFEREVKPFAPDSWVDTSYKDAKDGKAGRVGYEINFNRYFYKYVPPRPIKEIDKELKGLGREITKLMKEVME